MRQVNHNDKLQHG